MIMDCNYCTRTTIIQQLMFRIAIHTMSIIDCMYIDQIIFLELVSSLVPNSGIVIYHFQGYFCCFYHAHNSPINMNESWDFSRSFTITKKKKCFKFIYCVCVRVWLNPYLVRIRLFLPYLTLPYPLRYDFRIFVNGNRVLTGNRMQTLAFNVTFRTCIYIVRWRWRFETHMSIYLWTKMLCMLSIEIDHDHMHW